MSIAIGPAKRRLAIGLLAFATLWPLAQRGLVAAFDVNAWKLGGFAMYATPTPPRQVVIFRKGEGGLVVLDERALPASARATIARFRVERHALGKLRSPDDVGDALLAARPDLAWVVVAVQQMRLDRETARMTSTREQFVYERPGGD